MAFRWLSPRTSVLRQVWRLIVFVVGITVLLLGVAMIVLPGPAFVVIPLGLAILATEFVWAARLLLKVKERARDFASSKLVTKSKASTP